MLFLFEMWLSWDLLRDRVLRAEFRRELDFDLADFKGTGDLEDFRLGDWWTEWNGLLALCFLAKE